MKLSLIAALSRNRIMAKPEGGIPWKLPRDTRHFREYTAGKWILLGRKTYGEMEGWFTDQTPVILTRQEDLPLQAPGHHIAGSLAEAMQLAENHGAAEFVVCGGASVYETALPEADTLVLTHVNTVIESGITFPSYLGVHHWKHTQGEFWPADDENGYSCSLEILERFDT